MYLLNPFTTKLLGAYFCGIELPAPSDQYHSHLIWNSKTSKEVLIRNLNMKIILIPLFHLEFWKFNGSSYKEFEYEIHLNTITTYLEFWIINGSYEEVQ